MPIKKVTVAAFCGLMSLVGVLNAQQENPAVTRFGPAPDPGAIIFVVTSEDCRHVAMVVHQQDGTLALSVDGKQAVTAKEIVGVALSPNGKRLAYAVRENDRTSVVLDGVKQSPFSEVVGYPDRVIRFATLLFSPDGTRFGYQARRNDGQEVVIIDGQASAAYPGVRDLAFSPDSKHYLFTATKEKKGWPECCVVDGKEVATHDGIGIARPVFAPIGQEIAYQFNDNVVLGATVCGQTQSNVIVESNFAFSQDGRHFAYAVTRQNDGTVQRDSMLVTDAGVVHLPASANWVELSNDGKQLAYIRLDLGEKQFLPSVGPRGGPGIDREYVPRVVLDGAVGPQFQDVGVLFFSSDGKRLAYPGKQADGWHMVVNDKIGSVYQDMLKWGTFSQDSQHLAYGAMKNGKWIAVVDDAELSEYELVIPRIVAAKEKWLANALPVAFGGDGTLSFVALRNGELCQVNFLPPPGIK